MKKGRKMFMLSAAEASAAIAGAVIHFWEEPVLRGISRPSGSTSPHCTMAMHPSRPPPPLPLAMALDPSPPPPPISPFPSPSRRPLSALDSNTPLHPFRSPIKKPHILCSSAANHGHDYSGETGDCRGTKRKSPRRSGQETEAAQLFLSISPSIGSDTVSATLLDRLSSTDAATHANKIAKIENHSGSPHQSLLKMASPTIRESGCNEIDSELPNSRFDSKCDDKKPLEISMAHTVSTIVCSSKRPPAYPKRDKLAVQPPRLRLASQQIPPWNVSETTSLNSSDATMSVVAPTNNIVRALPSSLSAESSISNVCHRELSMLSSDNPIWISNSTVGDRGYGLIKSEQQFCETNGMHRGEANCGQIGKEWHKGGRGKAPNQKKLPNLLLQQQQQKKDQRSKMSQLSVLTDLLGQVRPGIIRKLRCRGQVHAAIAAMIGVSDTSCSGRRSAPTPSSTSSHIERSQEASCMALVKLAHLNKHRNGVHRSRASASDQEAGDSATESLETAEVKRMGSRPSHAEHCLRPGELEKDDGSAVSENLIPCWLELLRLDLKGRLSALKRSRKRVRGVILSPEFDMGPSISSSRCSSIHGGATEANIELQKWKDFFLHMDDALCSEGDKLETWLRQVVEMQNHCQNKGSAPPPWEMTSCLPSAICRMNAEALGSNLGLQHSAAKTSRCPAS